MNKYSNNETGLARKIPLKRFVGKIRNQKLEKNARRTKSLEFQTSLQRAKRGQAGNFEFSAALDAVRS